MKLGLIGLGRMGANMARRLARGGVEVVGYDLSPEARAALNTEPKVQTVDALEALVAGLPAPRVLWLMLPAGPVTQQAIDRLAELASPGDLIVDGGNAYYKDSMRRAEALKQRGIAFVDAGVSGGVWGLENGYTLTLGGDAQAVAELEPFVRILAPAPDRGWLHCGPSGSGHFVKMVHNGIEYGAMQAYAEGFALLAAKSEFQLDVAAIAETWRHGSVIRSWLLDLTAQALAQKPDLDSIAPVVGDSGEGRWTALEGVELGIPTPVMSLALMMRFATQGKNDYPAKLLALMRNAFGGHAIAKR
ncbi:MAG: decarboxylating 6-phosphogluconate dehydrogenase [Burkholderiales bacterium]|nr:decarboxylating 6-phosphogluconate dehydrogenase [Burkholderiales bacterium]PZN06378.1 MAG: decarboxylating 6-phosphogluconate dehydrogenase [Pseudomonadota bacterium]